MSTAKQFDAALETERARVVTEQLTDIQGYLAIVGTELRASQIQYISDCLSSAFSKGVIFGVEQSV